MRRLSFLLIPSLLACASGGGAGAGEPAQPAPGAQAATTPPAPNLPWAVKTREHVDLWLHGYAMLTSDTSRIPLFRRGYREAMTVAKNRGNVLSKLDAEREKLAARLATHPDLVNGQFLPLYFGSWTDMRRYLQIFLQANGDPRAAPSQDAAQAIALIAQSFPAGGDREWLRVFVQALDNESELFYHSWWVARQRDRAPTLAAVDSIWQKVARPKIQRFLNNTQQTDGEVLLSFALDGEGRTVAATKRQNVVTVGFPETPADAAEAVYVIAHEVVGNLASQAVSDNTTPAEKRSGAQGRYQSHAAIIAGYLLLQKTLPQLADGYARYYLRAANANTGINPGASPGPTLEGQFPIPQLMRESIARQIDVVLGGI